MIINSCINPFIYAWTIPAFREIVKKTIFCVTSQKRKDSSARGNMIMGQHAIEQKSANRSKKISYSMTYL